MASGRIISTRIRTTPTLGATGKAGPNIELVHLGTDILYRRVRNTFTSLGMDHRVLRRRISAIYSRSFVRTSPHVRAILHCLLAERMLPTFLKASSSSDGSLDVPSLFHAFALDFVSLLAFGISRGTNFIEDERKRWRWMEQLRLAYPDDKVFWMREHPFLVRLLSGIGIPILPKAHFQAVKEREDWVLGKVSECEDVMHGSEGKIHNTASLTPGELPIIYAYMRSAMERTAQSDGHSTLSPHQTLEVASEILDHISKCLLCRETNKKLICDSSRYGRYIW